MLCILFACRPKATPSVPDCALFAKNSPPDCFLRCRPSQVLVLTHKRKNSHDLKVITVFLVGMTGLEPAASCSQSRRSTKLGYIPKFAFLSITSRTQKLFYHNVSEFAIPIFIIFRFYCKFYRSLVTKQTKIECIHAFFDIFKV